MHTLLRLKPGDKIALACPGARCLSEAEVQATQQYLEKLGYTVVYSVECYTFCPAEQKAEIFMAYLQNPSVRLVWALRGGEGSADLLPYLEKHKTALKQLSPTLLFGFSDFTVLLNYVVFQFNWPVVHGMGALQLIKEKLDRQSREVSLALLEGEKGYAITNLMPLNGSAHLKMPIIAGCCGGTLSLLNIAIGDVWAFSPKNTILIIEDVGEKAYQVIRTLKYLKRVGFFDGVKAIVFGDMTAKAIGDTPEAQAKSAGDILRYLGYFAETCDCPVFQTGYFGHGQTNLPIPFGIPAVIGCDFRLKFV